MNDFFQGIIACVAMLGGICGFNYWMFLMMEKRIDTKLDVVVNDVHSLCVDVSKLSMRMDQQSKRTDQLYEICIDLIKDNKTTREKK